MNCFSFIGNEVTGSLFQHRFGECEDGLGKQEIDELVFLCVVLV